MDFKNQILFILLIFLSRPLSADTIQKPDAFHPTKDTVIYCYCPDTFGVCLNESDTIELYKIKQIAIKDSLFLKPIGDIIITIASRYLDIPYGTPKRKYARQENLLIGFDKFNCVTLVETVLAIAKIIKANKIELNEFASELKRNRYRSGILGNFSSRLHYFSEWVYDNEKRGIVKDMSYIADSTVWGKKIHYMSSNKKKYKQLKKKETYNEMRQIEAELSKRKRFYIPLEKFDSCKTKIQNGDVLIMTVTTPGLDVSHTGFAIWKNDELYLLHASSKEKKVVLSEKNLKEYLTANKKTNGILVA